MKIIKKALALIMVTGIVFNSTGLKALAVEDSTVFVQNEEMQEDSTDLMEVEENQSTDATEVEENQSTDATEVEESPSTEVVGAEENQPMEQNKAKEEQSLELNETMENQPMEMTEAEVNQSLETVGTTEKQKAFEYVYVDEQTVNIPEEQNIAVVFADTEMVLESATLHYSMIETGVAYDIAATNIVENSVLFTQLYSDFSQVGQYRADSITYRIAGQVEDININFADQDISVEYTVTAEESIEENTEESVAEETPEVTVYSMDDSGNSVEKSGEVEAIESTVENVLEVADEQGIIETAMIPEVASRARTGQKTSKDKVIVICAGHDATHTGTRGNGLKEEELSWKVAQYCQEELERYMGVTVYLDRNSINCAYPGQSTNYCLNQRVKDAAAKGASVFVDIHFNSVNGVSTTANGAEVYYPNNSYSTAIHQDGKKLANNILEKLTALGLYNRGSKIKDATDGSKDQNGNLEDYFTSINMSKAYGMTGIIVEHAFLDNAGDAAKLKDEAFLKQLGVADANGIVKTYGLSKDSGWKTDEKGNVSYYVNNKKVYGEKKINGSWYFFDEKTGYMVTGWHNFPTKKVYYNTNGQMVKGEQKINGKWYFFDNNTGAMKTGWYDFPTKRVYYNSNGVMLYGKQTIDGVVYQFDTKTGALLNNVVTTGWSEKDGHKVYYNTNGQLVKGESKIDGKWYFFDNNTGAMKTGWHDFPAKKVYYNANGQMVKGESKIDGKWYFFDNNTGAMKTGWHDFSAKKVYYNASGEMVKGESKIDGKWYFFDNNTGAMKTGWHDLPAKKVYYNGNGQMVKGESKINGKWYFFDNNTGAMKTGWHDLPTKRVYYNVNGEMVYGTQIIDGVTRQFDAKTGALLNASVTTGWSEKDGHKIYYDTNGQLAKGEKKINGKWYFFDNNTGAMKTGWHDFPAKKVYYNGNGQMVKGEQKIDGKWYLFDNNTGAMKTGWHDFPAKRVYYNANGEMVKGESKIDGKWYFFDQNTGAMITGWYSLPTKKVYYDTTGQMVYGHQKINNANYYFESKTGAMATRQWVEGYYYSHDGKRRDEVIGDFYNITGTSTVTVQQMVKYYQENSPIAYPKEKLEKGGAASIEEFAKIFYEEANREGIKAEIAWVQAMLETGFLKFGGQVSIEQFNFAGLGAVDGGAKGDDFSSYEKDGVRIGARAQIQHLKAYANTEPLKEKCVDSRFKYVERGSAPVVEYLGIKENPSGKGWATDPDYGFKIRRQINKLLKL